MLCENPRITLETVRTLNLATFFPMEEGELDHNCEEVTNEVYASRPDLKDQPISNPDLTPFCDRSSFLKEGQHQAGYAEIIEAQPLPAGWAAQQAELHALAQGLELGREKRTDIYIDSLYAFATVDIHGAICKEGGLLMAGGKTIKNREEILKLLEVIWLPKEVAIMHCRGHQKGDDPITEGNRLADKAAKTAAHQEPPQEKTELVAPALT